MSKKKNSATKNEPVAPDCWEKGIRLLPGSLAALSKGLPVKQLDRLPLHQHPSFKTHEECLWAATQHCSCLLLKYSLHHSPCQSGNQVSFLYKDTHCRGPRRAFSCKHSYLLLCNINTYISSNFWDMYFPHQPKKLFVKTVTLVWKPG